MSKVGNHRAGIILNRLEIIHMSKIQPGTVEKDIYWALFRISPVNSICRIESDALLRTILVRT